jgi:choice-of-anchor C domain-containing protein
MAVATAALGTSPALAANPPGTQPDFVNGYFYGYPGTSAFETLYAGTPSATAISSWTVTSGSVDWINTYWQQPPGLTTGTVAGLSLDLNGTASAAHPSPAGTISQTFATAPGQPYTVTFEMAGNPVCGPSGKGVTVSAAGQSQHFGFSTTGTTTSNMDWANYTWVFTTVSTTTTLTIAADPSNTSNCGPAIGQVGAFYSFLGTGGL